ncbi:MAG: lysophospholipid acyltransferase family protein [Acidobacteria bacterium]|nr:lysophospholipid acyltransferase family protein [Acidobacteriota bacterium]
MDEKLPQFYRFADLSAYSFRERFLIRAAERLFCALVACIGRTLRIEVAGIENLESASEHGGGPIYSLWHEHIFFLTYLLRDRKIVAMASRSFDGEYIARVVTRFGFGTVRGSSSRGGIGALIEMARAVELGLPALITVDGPKGPPHVVKGGACLLAKRTGALLLPVSFEAIRFRRARSWDGLRIPMPFTRVRMSYGAPIPITATDDVESKRTQLQSQLDELERTGAVWRESNSK